MRRAKKLFLLAFFFTTAAALAAQAPPAAVISDGARDAAHPARMEEMQIPLFGVTVYGVFYGAAGAGAHPTALLLHGFPGYEQNVDLAQAMRRAGWNVLLFHYRGAWGSQGAFSFENAMDDTLAMLSYLRAPANATRLGVDPARIVVVGHSMGGLMAAWAGAHDTQLAGVVLISAANMAASRSNLTPEARLRALASLSDIGPLAGCTSESLLAELQQNSAAWDFLTFAPAMKGEPVLIIDANDGSAATARRMADALKQAGDSRVQEMHFDTDHPYSDQRIALESAVVNWLATLQP